MDENTAFWKYDYISGDSLYDIDPHEIKDRVLPFCVAVSVIAGEYEVDFGQKTVCVKAGETILIGSFIKHTVRMTQSGKLTHVHFLYSYATVDLFHLADVEHCVVADREIQTLLQAVNQCAGMDMVIKKIYTDKVLCELLLVLFHRHIIDSKKLLIEPRFQTALAFIHENLDKGITVEETISACGYTKTVFYQLFQNKMKITPHEYIETERFKIASRQLLEGKKVKEVVKAIGFHDISYFNKVFKRKYGMTPSEYRRTMTYHKGENI